MVCCLGNQARVKYLESVSEVGHGLEFWIRWSSVDRAPVGLASASDVCEDGERPYRSSSLHLQRPALRAPNNLSTAEAVQGFKVSLLMER